MEHRKALFLGLWVRWFKGLLNTCVSVRFVSVRVRVYSNSLSTSCHSAYETKFRKLVRAHEEREHLQLCTSKAGSIESIEKGLLSR